MPSKNREYFGSLILTSDETEDIALIRVEAVDVPSLTLANSNDVKVGDDVLLVGAPLGLEQTISTGIVSAVRVSESGLRVIPGVTPEIEQTNSGHCAQARWRHPCGTERPGNTDRIISIHPGPTFGFSV